MSRQTLMQLSAVLAKNVIYRKRRWFRTIIQLLTPVLLFLSFAFIRSKIDNLEKKIQNEPFYNTEYSSEHLYNDKFDHETIIHFTPCNHFTSELMYQVQLKFYLNIEAVKCHKSEEHLLHNINYENIPMMAVIFNNLTSNLIPNHLSYVIRPYTEHVHWDTRDLYKTSSSYTPDLDSATYLHQGFLALQMALETSYIEMVTNNSLPVRIAVQEFPFPPHTDKSGTIDMINYILPLTGVLSFIFSCTIFLPRIVEEKVTGMKDFLKINGVTSWMLWIGWFIDEFFMNLTTTLSITIFLKYPLFTVATPPVENCDFTLLFVFLILYSVSTITFCYALSAFFYKPTYSVVVALMVWILTYLIPSTLLCRNVTISYDLIYGIFPNGLLIFGFKILSIYEIRETILNWKNLFDLPSGGSHDLTMGIVFMMFIINIITWSIIGISVEKIFPGPYGIHKRNKFWSLLSRVFRIKWFQKNQGYVQADDTDNIKMEDCNLPVSIVIKNLTKRFDDIAVVKNVSIDVYDEQITVLLGKNGAGKTTLLSMITGMLNSTSGSIKFNHENDASSIAFCPQHNLQFGALTVLEQLHFFGKIKGLSKKEISLKINELLKLTNLTHKKNKMVSTLSEGMRRKLSLAITVIGNSNIIVLDEPSSGLDPEIRRDIWNFIITLRGFRTIIITTHLMEEAKALGDRIIILDNGSVIDYGSPIYLSRKFGAGIKLHVVFKENANKSKFEEKVNEHEAVVEFPTESSVQILFDKMCKEQFIQLLAEVEKKKEEFEIAHVNFTYTTLEDAFLKAVEAEPPPSTNDVFVNIESDSESYQEVSHGKNCFIVLKKWISFTKWSIHILQILTLVLTMVSLLYLGECNKTITGQGLFKFELNEYGHTKVYFGMDNSNHFHLSASKIYSDLIKGQDSAATETSNISDAIIGEGVKNIEFYKKYMVVSTEFITEENGDNVAKAMYSNSAIHASPISLNLLLNTLLKKLAGDQYLISSAINPLPFETNNKFGHIYTVQIILIWCLLLPLTMILIASLYIVIPQIEKASNLKQLQLMSNVSYKEYWFTCYFWNLLTYIFVTFISLLVTYGINYIFTMSSVFTESEIATLFILLLAFGVAVMPYCYLYSYGRSTTSTLGFFVIFNILISNTLMIIVFYLETSNDQYLENIAKTFSNVFHVFPVFGLQHTLSQFVKKSIWNYNWNHTSLEHKEAICKSSYNPCCYNDQQCVQYQSYLNKNSPIFANILEMYGSTFLYILILFLLEMRSLFICKKRYQIAEEDFATAESSETNKRTVRLMVTNVSKKRGKEKIVEDINFEISKNECLGLLGANGAGKTTISRLLAKEKNPDSGKILYKFAPNKKVIGYCPQLDCSSSLSSGKSMLKYFGQLRGAEESEVTRLIDAFGLQKCANKLSSKYSGGSKRKLGTAIAVIGNPDLIILDEPTAGVDPVSRQRLRNELRTIKEKSSMIISTHIIEDCEMLCNKVAVLKQGNILQNAAIAELKNKINQTVTVKLKIKNENNNTITNVDNKKKVIKEINEWESGDSTDVKHLKKAFYETFEKCNLEDQHATLLKYNIEVSKMRYNEIFCKVEELQNRHSVIEDYEINTTTLEDVFLNISNQESNN